MIQIEKLRTLIGYLPICFALISCTPVSEKSTIKSEESYRIEEKLTNPNNQIPELAFIDYTEIGSANRIQWREMNRQIDQIVKRNVTTQKIEVWKRSEIRILDVAIAWQQLKVMHPDLASQINLYTEVKGYYIFSLPSNSDKPSTESYFRNFVFTQYGSREFWTVSTQ